MKEKLTVIKVGGKIVEEETTLSRLLADFSAIEGYKLLVIGGTMLASLINSKFVRGKRLFQTINFLPYLTAPVAVGILFGLMFDQQNGVVNEALKSMGLLNEGLYWLKDGNLARIVVMIMCTWKYMGCRWP